MLQDLQAMAQSDVYVVLQKDSEGNGYSPLNGVELGYYIPNNTWSGEFYDSETEALAEGEPIRALVFYPIN